MRIFFEGFITIGVGIVLGALSLIMVLDRNADWGQLRIGTWSATPFIGGRPVTPYTQARLLINRTLPIGNGEGIRFIAINDETGAFLQRNCLYRLSGQIPQSQFWTMVAYSPKGEVLATSNGERSALLSTDIVRFAKQQLDVNIGNVPLSGNWMPISGSGRFELYMTLYDTSLSNSADITAPKLPVIERLQCN